MTVNETASSFEGAAFRVYAMWKTFLFPFSVRSRAQYLTAAQSPVAPLNGSAELVLTSTCESPEEKLLSQTEGNMETHTSSEVCEYKASAALRIWVVGIRKRG
jgi:hypothetical protein